MILQPVLHPILLVLLCAVPAALVTRALVRRAPGRSWWALRLGMVVVVFLMLLRPGIPGGAVQTLAADTDVVLAVDTTASIVAEDWDGDRPRLDGLRADVRAIMAAYPGARFAVIGFDASAQLRLPLTTDATALMSTLDVLRPEVTDQSRGSSIGIAERMLAETLAAAAEAAPERSRMVFYLGDGEQTVSRDPESFAGSARYVDGGGVLGYGTAQGGPMRRTTGDPSTGSDAQGEAGSAQRGEYIQYQGEPAMSVIDEDNLRRIAEQLGVDYQHRSADAKLDLPPAPTSTTDAAASGEVGDVIELYWILALVLVAMLGVELARTAMLVTRLRALRVAQPVPGWVPEPVEGPAPGWVPEPVEGPTPGWVPEPVEGPTPAGGAR